MSKLRAGVWVVAMTAFAALVCTTGPDAACTGNFAADVAKIAAAIRNGDIVGARKMAVTVAKKGDSLEDAMALFKIRMRTGPGFRPDANDGIESRIREAARDAPKAKDAPLFEEAGYTAAAIGLIAEAFTPRIQEEGKATRKQWEKYSQDLVESAQGLAKAGKAKEPADMKAAAIKVNNACNACHALFRN